MERRLDILLAAALLLSLPLEGISQEHKLTLREAALLVPRPAFDPVKSLIPGETPLQGDTVDTSNPAVSIVLGHDGSWRYIKNAAAAAESAVFSDHWSETEIDPYRINFESFPYKTTLVLADSASRFCCPYHVKVFSAFKRRNGRNHNGVDLPMHNGTEVYAMFDGKVRVSTYHRGYGNVIIIRHESGVETVYAHLSRRDVEAGDWVNAGDLIALSGSTGRVTGPHLHLETRYKGYAFDPEWIVDFEKGILRHGVFNLRASYLSISSNYVPEDEMEEEEIYRTEEEYRAEQARIAAEKAAEVWHKVKNGDNLSSLAVRYGTTVSRICELNGISAKSTLRIGQNLRMR